MSGKFREYSWKNVRIHLLNGEIVCGYVTLALAAEEDSDGVEFDSIQLGWPGDNLRVFFEDEVKFVEIIEP